MLVIDKHGNLIFETHRCALFKRCPHFMESPLEEFN